MKRSNQHLKPSTSAANGQIVSVILTLRLLMQGKEVGSIIGKRGSQIRAIREESSAKINISDGSSPERIVSITGNIDIINKAFHLICMKFQEDQQQLPNCVPVPPITMRLIIPAVQCGSLIGKGGSKIKEIREASGVSIQVASEMLPNSTERAVTISGTANAIVQCIQHICKILLETPVKGNTIPYQPKAVKNQTFQASTPTTNALAQQQQALIAASLLQPLATSVFNPLDLARMYLPYTTTQFHQTLPALDPYTVMGRNLLMTPQDNLKDQSVRWPFTMNEDYRNEMMYTLRGQPQMINASLLATQPTQLNNSTAKPNSNGIGPMTVNTILQQSSHRYAPY